MAITIKGGWRKETYGHVYTAKALTETGRILAVVNIEVPLNVAVDIHQRFGEEWVREVERSAQDQVRRAASGWDAITEVAAG
jgi:hypothetical protein